ncbi:LysR family transcriptional regulator [Lelliottia sp. CFBP8978]|uniref:LysR family transcriptional regulator n=1 Tax=Lelliottia sp. CFBP8978 TaxID=3096522 RepID=UPI002A6AE2EF|nr:LysR family transcriptional regulator [Lelliottia sp. CFBP8978]MDY1035400.1 LysR family transcriptional regulator [Lelliottia sp. CFBP8978]
MSGAVVITVGGNKIVAYKINKLFTRFAMGIFLSKKMRYFMVIMRNKNFGKAAEELCITRSPLSKALTELEMSLGGKLFSRRHNDLEPTQLAWDCYNSCLPAYQNLLAFEESLRKNTHDTQMNIYVDISVPPLLAQHLQSVFQSENLKFGIKRTHLTNEEFYALKYQSNSIVLAFRSMDPELSFQCDSWHGCHHVILRSSTAEHSSKNNKFFVWKDQHTQRYKTRIKNILGPREGEPEFIEHNHNLFTLLSFIRAGKGVCISSEKMARLFRLEGIDIEQVETSYIRCFIYHNADARLLSSIKRFKELLGEFI